MDGVTNIFNISGNYIDKQYIAAQYVQLPSTPINNTPIQTTATDINCDVSNPPSATKRPTRKPKTNKLIDNTFKYRYLDSHSQRIIRLYQQLQSGQCIAQDTTPEDFSSIFSGKPSNVKVKWLQDTSLLFALIKQINDRSLIEKPTRPGIWEITQSHFVNKDSRPFTYLRSQKLPNKAKATITMLVNIIDPSIKEDY